MVQLVLDERQAEILTGLIGIAKCAVDAKAAPAITVGGVDQPKATLALLFSIESTSAMECAMSILYGVPCPQHDGRSLEASKLLSATDKEVDDEISRLGRILAEFILPYRREKISALPERE